MYPKQGIFLTFLWLLVIDSVCSNQFSVTPITTSSGLYYENIGKVLLSNNNWKFITSVDYKEYILYFQYLLQQADQMGQFCKNVTCVEECESKYNLIKHRLKRFEEIDESLASFLGVTNKRGRVKRFIASLLMSLGTGALKGALSNIGGGSDGGNKEQEKGISEDQVDSKMEKIQGELQSKIDAPQKKFEEDSKEKEEKLKELENMLSETDERLKLHTEAQKKLGNQVDEIKKKILQIDENIKKLNEEIIKNRNRINESEIKIQLNSIFIDLDLLMTKFENEHKLLYKVIKNANKGNLDPYILTPLNLVDMLKSIHPNLPEETKFPFYPNIENAHKLYNIIKTSFELCNTKIIFYHSIPLVYSITFSLHKITSLPVAVSQNKFAFILPKHAFLIIDRKYQYYMLMSSNDYRDFCTEIESSNYFCNQVQQTSLTYTSKDCELILFRPVKCVPDSCKKRVMYLSSPLFLQLQQPNSWIYVIPETISLILNCDKNHTAISLQGTGFIHINQDCNMHTGGFLLTTVVKFSKPVVAMYSPPLNLTSVLDDSQFGNIEDHNSRHKQLILPFEFDELSKISSALTQKWNINKNNLLKIGRIYCALAAIPLILAAILGFLIWKKKIALDPLLNIFHRKEKKSPIQACIEESQNYHDIECISISESPSLTNPDAEDLPARCKIKKDIACQFASKPSTCVISVLSRTPVSSFE